ncbi:hypothetical protein EIKCOROL_00199 [Eikenella corrodens ATCC 23834]|uniref:Uncharacterized protein n=1 Tax=Eikenella corrodens ATCC 23834 TaxID=546274 RepID=C0DS77_EIKCO|nr:hypothetical protein EIKCOROL_00199 [Eikenella corrodens ATCC 23834]
MTSEVRFSGSLYRLGNGIICYQINLFGTASFIYRVSGLNG